MKHRQLLQLSLGVVLLLVLHEVGLWALLQWGVMDQLLAPSQGSAVTALFATLFFLGLRLLLVLVLPGLVLARLFWRFTQPRRTTVPTGEERGG